MEGKLFRYETEISIVQSSVRRLNPQFSLCDVLVCYHGDNRNNTSISKGVIEQSLYSIYGIPIVGEWIYKMDGSGEGTWGSHGGRIIIDDQGVRYEQTTVPFGFVSIDAAEGASWVTVTEKDGHTQNEYLKLSGCILWTERYEEAKSILDRDYGQSMEIEILKGGYRDDGVYRVDDFVFSALCILGTVEPCFESACIGRHYGLDAFKKEFSLMLDEYKKLQTTTDVKGETDMQLSKFAEFLSAMKIDGTDSDRYALLNASDDMVFAIDMTDYKPYGFNYAVTDADGADAITIDFGSKTEMSLTATDKIDEDGFKGFCISAEIDKAADAKIKAYSDELQDSFDKKCADMQARYEELDSSFKEAGKRLAEYEEKERKATEAEHEAAVDELFSRYADKLGRCADFIVYRARVSAKDASLDEIEQNLTLMLGRHMMEAQGKKSFSYAPVTADVHQNGAGTKDEKRYGDLLKNYMN